MYKLIALDIDGTLLNSKKQITTRVRSSIISAKKQGVKVVLASGRPYLGMLEALTFLGLSDTDDFALSYNGALVVKGREQQIISNNFLNGKDALELYYLANSLGVNILAYTTEYGLITPKKNKYTDFEAEHNAIDFTEFDFTKLSSKDEVIKIMMVDEPEILDVAINKLPKSLKPKYSMARSMPFFFEFMSNKSNKGKGIETLAKHLGFNASEVICVGDADNDLEMLQFAGLGVAMGNAEDWIKAHADYVTLSNDQDGVAHVIEQYILN